MTAAGADLGDARGIANKLNLEVTWVDQQRLEPGASALDGLLVTLQAAAGI